MVATDATAEHAIDASPEPTRRFAESLRALDLVSILRRVRALILGGTKFLGRGVVDEALARAHEVTLFNRGETNPELYPDVEKLRGDRDGDLSALEGRDWDYVIDLSGYLPRVVRASAELLAGHVEHYVFVSSISVYGDFSEVAREDETPLIRLDDTSDESLEGDRYGGFKALCELVVADAFPGRSARVRAGLIVGPNDPTGRFTYWPSRIARGGEVLAPGRRGRQVQFIDVRDLGAWLVDLGERRVSGAFNATGPEPPVTMGELLETCRAVSGSSARITWVEEEFLREREVGEWMELPLWIAETGDEAWRRFQEVDVSRAVAEGLRFRTLADTVRDTLEWALVTGDPGAPLASGLEIGVAGMDAEREAELLAEWRAQAR
jgi:2'-hydroxyisoflavone reductase